MNKDDEEFLKSNIEGLFSIKQEFSTFSANTRISLLLSQINFFQVLSASTLVIIGIITSLGYFEMNNLLIISSASSILLLVYTFCLPKEMIDSQDEYLRSAEKYIDQNHKEALEKIIQSFKEKDRSIYEKYAQKKVDSFEKKEPSLFQTGEIVLFLFYLSVLLIIFNFLALEIGVSTIVLLSIIISFTLSFKVWSLKMTEYLSMNIKDIFQPAREGLSEITEE